MKAGMDYVGTAVVFYCHDGNGNYVMNKRSDKCRDEIGVWDFGGGALGVGESLEECVKREVYEEYGIRPEDFSFLGFSEKFRKHEEIGWFTLENLPSPLFSSSEEDIERFREKL